MAQTPTGTGQAWVAASADIAEGAQVGVTDADATVVATTTALRTAQFVFYSSPDVATGQTYTVTVDGAQAATATEGQFTGGMGGGPGGQGGMGGGPGGRGGNR